MPYSVGKSLYKLNYTVPILLRVTHAPHVRG